MQSDNFINLLNNNVFVKDTGNINNGYPIIDSFQCNIEYSTEMLTNKDIIVKIVANRQLQEIEGWTLSIDKKILTKEYSDNVKETVLIRDINGNQQQVDIEITNIDKIAPTVNVVYSTKDSIKENVLVTIKTNKEVQEIEGWTLSADKKMLTKEYSENTKETIIVKDLAGNETKADIEINNIDKVAPKVEVEYNTKEMTMENVIVTIISNEEIQELEGWTLSADKKVLMKEYDGNTSEIITIRDLVGNEINASIEIKNIDKIAPNVKVEYSIKEITKENVVVIITSDEEIQEVEGWTLSANKKMLTKEYGENASETITVKDLAGNETKANIEISNIDKIKRGDINNNRKIDITDLFLLKRHIIAGSRENWKLTGDSLIASDINEDGNVDVTDLLILKREVIDNI